MKNFRTFFQKKKRRLLKRLSKTGSSTFNRGEGEKLGFLKHLAVKRTKTWL